MILLVALDVLLFARALGETMPTSILAVVVSLNVIYVVNEIYSRSARA